MSLLHFQTRSIASHLDRTNHYGPSPLQLSLGTLSSVEAKLRQVMLPLLQTMVSAQVSENQSELLIPPPVSSLHGQACQQAIATGKQSLLSLPGHDAS